MSYKVKYLLFCKYAKYTLLKPYIVYSAFIVLLKALYKDECMTPVVHMHNTLNTKYNWRKYCLQYTYSSAIHQDKCLWVIQSLLQVGVCRRVQSVVPSPLTFSSQELLGQPLPNLVCNICWVKMRDIVSIQSKGDILFKQSALKKYLFIVIDRTY